jgi:hypothetical protein
MTKEELGLLNDTEKLVVTFREKQEMIDVNQEELHLMARDYYRNKFSMFEQGNFYLSIYRNGAIYVYYQQNGFYLWRTSETFLEYDDDNKNKIEIHGDNLIEKQFHYSCGLRNVITSGIQHKSCPHHFELIDKKSYLIFNELNADDVFKKYGFKKSKITKQGIIALFNKMNELGDAIPISINDEFNDDLKNRLVNFYEKQKLINKKQQELYFIAKDYYGTKYPMLEKGNFYLNKRKYDGIDICYQSDDLKVYRTSKTFYEDREKDKRNGYGTYRYKRSENLIEENFSFDCTFKKVVSKGICDKHEFNFHNFYKTYVLFKDSTADDVFKKYGFKKSKITKQGITQLFVKMRCDLTPYEYEYEYEF